MAHKTDDSGPESYGDADDGYEDPYADIDVKAFVKQLEKQQDKKIVQKPPPTDVNDATVQLACFRPINETPDTLGAILLARADPNLVVGDGISPLRRSLRSPELVTLPQCVIYYFNMAPERVSSICNDGKNVKQRRRAKRLGSRTSTGQRLSLIHISEPTRPY